MEFSRRASAAILLLLAEVETWRERAESDDGVDFFFFQAEDGIRDLYVTGVQTCALPISSKSSGEMTRAAPWAGGKGVSTRAACASRRAMSRPEQQGDADAASRRRQCADLRSEERRVGKECRARRWPYH